jgi:hypothetical protein
VPEIRRSRRSVISRDPRKQNTDTIQTTPTNRSAYFDQKGVSSGSFREHRKACD